MNGWFPGITYDEDVCESCIVAAHNKEEAIKIAREEWEKKYPEQPTRWESLIPFLLFDLDTESCRIVE